MSNKDLVREIQKEAIDGKSDLSTVLRKCLVLASRLGHEPLKNWVQWELDGYPTTSDVPEYRVLHGLESFGHFAGIAGLGMSNAPLSSLRLPESVRKRFTDPQIREGVKAIAEMIRGNHDGAIRWAWPVVANEVFNHEGYREDLRLM